jgi:two-component sensor histidine kinase
MADATGLGLSIVRVLVTSELVGELSMTSGDGSAGRPGTVVRLEVPVADRDPT